MVAFGHSMRARLLGDRLLDPIDCAYECFGLLSLKLAVTAEIGRVRSRACELWLPQQRTALATCRTTRFRRPRGDASAWRNGR